MSGERFEKDKALVFKEFGGRINRLLPMNMGPGTPVRQLITSIVKAYPSDIKASDDDRVNQAIQALFGKRMRQRRSDAIDDSAGIRRMEELYASDCLLSGTTAPRSIETLASIVASDLAPDDDAIDRMARRLRQKFDALDIDISTAPEAAGDDHYICHNVQQLQEIALWDLEELLPQIGIKMKP